MRFALFAVLCLAPVDSRAQTPPLSVDEAVAQAFMNSPTVTAAVRRVSAAEEGVRAARAKVNPQLALTPSMTRSGSDEELLIQQPLEVNGGRAARAAIALAQLRLAEAEAVTTQTDAALAVKSSYDRLVRARERRALARDLVEDAEEFHRAAARQVELGARPGIEQTQAAIELSLARQQLSLAEAEESVARAALNAEMGRNPADPVGELTPFQPLQEPVDRERALRTALENRSELAPPSGLFRWRSPRAAAQRCRSLWQRW